MATLNFFNSFYENLAEGKHNLSGNGLTVVLCNSANAPVASNTVLANLTTIDHTNLSSRVVTVTSSSQTSGVYRLFLTDLVLTPSGTVPTFRYVVLYDNNAANDELIGWYDRGTDVDLGVGDTFTVDFDETNGAIVIRAAA